MKMAPYIIPKLLFRRCLSIYRWLLLNCFERPRPWTCLLNYPSPLRNDLWNVLEGAALIHLILSLLYLYMIMEVFLQLAFRVSRWPGKGVCFTREKWGRVTRRHNSIILHSPTDLKHSTDADGDGISILAAFQMPPPLSLISETLHRSRGILGEEENCKFRGKDDIFPVRSLRQGCLSICVLGPQKTIGTGNEQRANFSFPFYVQYSSRSRLLSGCYVIKCNMNLSPAEYARDYHGSCWSSCVYLVSLPGKKGYL